VSLNAVFKNDTIGEYVKADAAWTLGVIAQHSSRHSKSVRVSGAIKNIMEV